jgi:hypothetical protein
MSPKEATKLSGRSESWLRRHECAWCQQTLWRALRYGCGAIYDKCTPAEKSFGPEARRADQ